MDQEPLRPRFKIVKSRIDANPAEDPESDFIPDKVIYVELDDEITNLFDAVKRVRGTHIALVIPKRAAVLQSIVNLKILKKKIDDVGKKILIVTADLQGLNLAKKVGIASVEKLFEKSREPTPMLKRKLLQTERPMRMAGEKISLSRVIRPDTPKHFSLLLNRLKERFKKKQKSPKTRLVFIAPNKQALFTLILVSILLLLAIAYIALPGATIEITPKSSVLNPAFNVTFLDYKKNRGALEEHTGQNIVIPSFPVDPPPLTKKIIWHATGKIFKGENARGVLTIVNLSPSPWDLAVRTRFQTNEGIVFRILKAIRIPPARGQSPGMLDVPVVADEFDIYNQVLGNRGNIGPSKFFLPGLKNEENRKKLYAESKSGMTGGLTRTILSITQADLDAAKEEIKREIIKGAAQDLKKYLEQENLIQKTNLSLLTDRNVIKVSEPHIETPEDRIGEPGDQFEVTATYTVNGFAFDRQKLIEALKERIVNRVDPDKKIIKIQEDDISYRFLDEDAAAGRVRLTTTMRAIQMYDLDPEKENGHRFIKKITDHILGLRLKEAEEYLQQQTNEVSRVKITTWPIWAPTIPTITDNVKFVIKQDELIE